MRCPAGWDWDIDATYLYLNDGCGWRSYLRLPQPRGLRDEFAELVDTFNIGESLRLVLVPHLGYGGLFLPGLVVLGSRDINQIADDVGDNFVPVHPFQIVPLRRQGVLVLNRAERRLLVRERVLRHEFGHALRFYLAMWTPYFHEEAAADFLTGMMDAFDNIRRDAGELVFAQIGCSEQPCTHPTAAQRVRAYRRGYAHGLQLLRQVG